MHSIRMRSKVGKNGLLQLQLPQATEGLELDIILVYEPAPKFAASTKVNPKFYGCIRPVGKQKQCLEQISLFPSVFKKRPNRSSISQPHST